MVRSGMLDSLEGVFVPVITPFDAHEDIELDSLRFNLERLNGTDVRGYLALGTNGESVHLTEAEQIKVLQTIVETASTEKVVMGGIGRQSARATIEFGKLAARIGIQYASVITPSYFTSSMNDLALERFFLAVADALPIPLLIYNIPKSCAGIQVSEELVSSLSKHPNIVGMKDSSSGWIEKYCSAADSDFSVVAGSINNLLAGLKAGATGGVISIANYAPEHCAEAYALFRKGKEKESEEKIAWLRNISSRATGSYGVAGIKAGCDSRGFRGGYVRVPLTNCTEEQKLDLQRVFLEAGLK